MRLPTSTSTPRLFGIQGRWSFSTGPKPKRVSLRPVSSLKGRLVAADRTMAKGWRVFAYTRPGDDTSAEPETNGFARGMTDDEGRFSFPVIAPGWLRLVLKPPSGDARPGRPAPAIGRDRGTGEFVGGSAPEICDDHRSHPRARHGTTRAGDRDSSSASRAGRAVTARPMPRGDTHSEPSPGTVGITVFRIRLTRMSWHPAAAMESNSQWPRMQGGSSWNPSEVIPAAPHSGSWCGDEVGRPSPTRPLPGNRVGIDHADDR